MFGSLKSRHWCGHALLWAAALGLAPAAVIAREAATPAACQAASRAAPISDAKTAIERSPDDPQAAFHLADAWSEAGCFTDALQTLNAAAARNPGNKELATRLRVARSVVGEEQFFKHLDEADAQAKLKRDVFRCTSLSDVEACGEASRLRPDDGQILAEQGDALMKANRSAEALASYRRAAAVGADPSSLSPKIAAAQAILPAAPGVRPPSAPSPAAPAAAAAPTSAGVTLAANRPSDRTSHTASTRTKQYSNLEPEAHSH